MNLTAKVLASDVDTDALRLNIAPGASSVGDLIATILPWVSLAAGVVAFAYLLYSGFLYMTAGGNAETAKKGQAGILNAIIGLIIIALAYTITTALVGTFNEAS